MTKETISKCYKLSSLVTLIISILGSMILIGGTMGEKIWVGLLVNLQFHLAFQFLSRVPFGMFQYIAKENPGIKTLTQMGLRIFSWMVMIFAVIGFIGFLSAALDDPTKLLATMTFPAIFLGGYSSKIKLSEN